MRGRRESKRARIRAVKKSRKTNVKNLRQTGGYYGI